MGYQFLAPKVDWDWLGGIGSLHVKKGQVGFDHNAITHLATHSKLQKIISTDLHPVYPKCGNAFNS